MDPRLVTPSGKRFMAAVRTQRKATKNAVKGVCEKSAKHGKATHGGLCDACWAKKLAYWKETRKIAREVREARRKARTP